MRPWLFAASLVLVVSACSKHAAPPPPPPSADVASSAPADLVDPSFIGRVWMSTTPRSPRGSMIVFLPDKTLLMDSCFETYRLSQWGIVGEDRIRWIEDTIPIEAQVIVRGKHELRLHVAGRDDEQTYTSASVPYVCPDMPR
jgi:hypothetical protein